MKIIIIGGGIGGLSAALALRQAGFEPQVFEQAPALLEVGAAIAVWPNAMQVLQRLGVGDEVSKKSGHISRVGWLMSDGRPLRYFSFPETNAPAVALHRADLQQALLHALPSTLVHLGKTFIGYRQQRNEVQAHFTDDTQVNCDVLIGADGLHSRARAQLLDDGQPLYRGYAVWRGVTHNTPASLANATALELYGRGRRFGIGPVGLGRTGWWATVNEGEYEDAESKTERQQKLLKLFAGWYAPVRELIESTPGESILRNGAYDRPPVSQWGQRRVTLLGDAAHPTTPNLGQGGCMAIEDASILAASLSKIRDAAQALRLYERIRRARTAAVTRYSLRYGMMGQWENPAAVRLRAALMSSVPEAVGQRLLRLIFAYDAEAVRS